MNQYEEIAGMVRGLVGHDYLYLDTALKVKQTPHSQPVNIWGICVGVVNEVYIMDANDQWHMLIEDKSNSLIISSLYQRIKTLTAKTKAI